MPPVTVYIAVLISLLGFYISDLLQYGFSMQKYSNLWLYSATLVINMIQKGSILIPGAAVHRQIIIKKRHVEAKFSPFRTTTTHGSGSNLIFQYLCLINCRVYTSDVRYSRSPSRLHQVCCPIYNRPNTNRKRGSGYNSMFDLMACLRHCLD